MTEKLINTNEEAIECLKKNKPTSGYMMLQESVDMAIEALEKLEKIKDVVNEWNKGEYSYSNNHMCEIKNILA